MSCPEKETLQRTCADSWITFESALENLGVPLNPNIGPATLRLINGLSGARGLIDPQTGTLKSPYLEAMALLREYQKASSRLSQHLHTHRC
jgi:hypothetical protein